MHSRFAAEAVVGPRCTVATICKRAQTENERGKQNGTAFSVTVVLRICDYLRNPLICRSIKGPALGVTPPRLNRPWRESDPTSLALLRAGPPRLATRDAPGAMPTQDDSPRLLRTGGISISTTSEFSRIRSNRIRLPSDDTSKRLSDSPGRRFVSRRRWPLAQARTARSPAGEIRRASPPTVAARRKR